MPSSFLLRMGLMLVPIFLFPVAQLVESGLVSFGYEQLGHKVTSFIHFFIPIIFAISASLTEPNVSKSWQIVCTITVYFVLQTLIQHYIPKFENSQLISAVFAAIIAGTLSSKITANSLHLSRYLISRFLNMVLLLAVCVAVLFFLLGTYWLIEKLFIYHDSSNILMQLPNALRSFICIVLFNLSVPFGLDNFLSEFIMWDPYLNTVSNQYIYSLCEYFTMLYGVTAMLSALLVKLERKKCLPVFFLIMISLTSGIYPGIAPYIMLMILWNWSVLYILNSLLASVIFVILLNLNLDFEFLLYSEQQKNIYDDYHSIYIMLFIIAVYFFTSMYVIKKFTIKKLTWRLKKQKGIKIKMIGDRKNSSDLSLFAIRLIKVVGGMDNIESITTRNNRISISYKDGNLIDPDALKSVGFDSYNENKKNQVTVRVSDYKKAINIVSKVVIFAEREFLDLSKGQIKLEG